MLFSKKRMLTRYEYSLVNGFLSEVIGVAKPWCYEVLHQEGYVLIDDWKNKTGFVKEDDGRVCTLTLHFQNERSHNYHLIVKNEAEEWADKQIIDFTYLMELGII